jgi:probable phosphoglycerate mutase
MHIETSHHKATTFFLIRHGETEWNRDGRWQGHADVPLSMRGREQAQALAQRLADERIAVDYIYASDLSRASETAQIVARKLGMPVHTLPDLRELHLGSWSGLTRSQIMQRFPGALVTFHHAHDGETRTVFGDRVSNAVATLAQQHPGQRLMLVTHGGVIRTLLLRLYERHGQPHAHVPPITNTSITELSVQAGSWRVLHISDGAHLGSEIAQDVMAPRNESMLPQ